MKQFVCHFKQYVLQFTLVYIRRGFLQVRIMTGGVHSIEFINIDIF